MDRAKGSRISLGQELAQALNEQLRKLPRQERFAVASAQRTEVLAEASDADLRVERALRELADLDAATAQRLSDVLPVPSQEQQQRCARRLLSSASCSSAWQTLDRKQLDILHEVDAAWHDLDSASQAARAKLTRFLFWIPAPPSTRTAGQAAPALAWLVSPANWRAAGEVVRHELTHRPFWPSVALVAAAALLALRRRLLHKLASITPLDGSSGEVPNRPRHCSARDYFCAGGARPAPALDGRSDARACVR